MDGFRFASVLLQVTVACLVWAAGVTWSMGDQISWWTYLVSISCYNILCVGIYMWARYTLARDHTYSFNGVISISFVLKLIMSLGILYLIDAFFHPKGNIHILHYIGVYIVYTIYEVYFLTKLAYT